VHLADFPAAADLDRWIDSDLTERWTKLIGVRDTVNFYLEAERKAKVIGSSLEARVIIQASGEVFARLRAYEADLPMLFIASQVTLEEIADDGTQPIKITVVRADGVKCQRCWRYVPEVSADPAFEGICSRCVDALASVVR
jgi:isoleucyl-tRNA synthetase